MLIARRDIFYGRRCYYAFAFHYRWGVTPYATSSLMLPRHLLRYIIIFADAFALLLMLRYAYA